MLDWQSFLYLYRTIFFDMSRLLILTALLIGLLSCNRRPDVAPLLVGNWQRAAYTSPAGDWITALADYPQIISFAKNGRVSGITGCGCSEAQTYNQQANVLTFTWGGTPCPTLVACPPTPTTTIVSLTENELILAIGQSKIRYKKL